MDNTEFVDKKIIIFYNLRQNLHVPPVYRRKFIQFMTDELK